MILRVLLIITFNFHFILIQSYITIPFEYINKKTSTSIPDLSPVASYYNSYMENSIYTTIKVNNKNIKFHLTFDRHATYISQSTINQLGIKPTFLYNEDKEVKLYSLEYIGIPNTTFAQCSFDFLQNNTQNISINNISFFISQKILNESPLSKKTKYLTDNPEEIGFNIYKGNKISEVNVEMEDPFEDYYPSNPDEDNDPDIDSDKTDYSHHNEHVVGRYVYKNSGYEIEENSNLINQLKKSGLISSFVFTVKYDKNDEKGNIIIGSLPHEYDPRHYSQNYFIYSNIVFRKETPAWRIIFDDIKYGTEKLISTNLAEFSINFGFISSSISNKQTFDVNFFLKPEFADYCREEQVNSYYIKYCKEKVIKEFKPLSFHFPKTYNSKSNDIIELNYQDLFVKCPGYDDIYCFQIIFGGMFSAWILGKPLFRKYNMVFDQEKKIVGFYKETGEYDYQQKINKEKSGNILPWILVGFLLVCLIFVGIFFYKKLTSNKRKKIANELEDEFIYELAVKKNNEEDDKNKLFKS